jgi:hypothetical protein
MRDGVVDLGELVLGNWASNVEPMTWVMVHGRISAHPSGCQQGTVETVERREEIG